MRLALCAKTRWGAGHDSVPKLECTVKHDNISAELYFELSHCAVGKVGWDLRESEDTALVNSQYKDFRRLKVSLEYATAVHELRPYHNQIGTVPICAAPASLAF